MANKIKQNLKIRKFKNIVIRKWRRKVGRYSGGGGGGYRGNTVIRVRLEYELNAMYVVRRQ